MSKEDKYIIELKRLIKEHRDDPEVFHREFDILLRNIIKNKLGFKRFFEILDDEKIAFWLA